MNYLAHLSLSFKERDLMLGNFIADNIMPVELAQLEKPVYEGVLLHRNIDIHTDRHEAFRAARDQLKDKHGKYSNVIVDIINDHFLARRWKDIYGESLRHFSQHVYDAFVEASRTLPPKAARHVDVLLQYRYLEQYEDKDALLSMMKKMDNRTRFPSDFVSAVDHVYQDYDFYESQFLALYTDIQAKLPTLRPRIFV